MKYLKGSLVTITPDQAAKHGDKLRLVDMKASRYRVEESFETKAKKVKSVARKAADKE